MSAAALVSGNGIKQRAQAECPETNFFLWQVLDLYASNFCALFQGHPAWMPSQRDRGNISSWREARRKKKGEQPCYAKEL